MTNRIGPVDPKMIGKIGNSIEETRGTDRASESPNKSKAAEAPASRQDDTVELTGRAQLLERVEKSLDTVPAVDSQRVAEVKAAIENGDYEIDAESIADAMIRLERAFGD